MRAVVKAVRGVGQGLDKFGQKFEAAPYVEGCTSCCLFSIEYCLVPGSFGCLSNACILSFRLAPAHSLSPTTATISTT
jgi:hypothetical protein